MADEERIDRVARALCVADGRDPEELVSSPTTLRLASGGPSFIGRSYFPPGHSMPARPDA